MIFLERLRAMHRLGTATLRVAERVVIKRIHEDDDARDHRLGDLEGQTDRAQAFASTLEDSLRVPVEDSTVVKPQGWRSIQTRSS